MFKVALCRESRTELWTKEDCMPTRTFMAVHVAPLADDRPRKWIVYRGRASRAIARSTTQALAIRIGRAEAKRTRVEFVVHGRDGRIRRKDSFGRDPRRRKG